MDLAASPELHLAARATENRHFMLFWKEIQSTASKEDIKTLCMSYRLVHLELYIILVAEQFIRPGRGELFRRVGQKQEVVEEESPEFLVALHLVHLKRNK